MEDPDPGCPCCILTVVPDHGMSSARMRTMLGRWCSGVGDGDVGAVTVGDDVGDVGAGVGGDVADGIGVGSGVVGSE